LTEKESDLVERAKKILNDRRNEFQEKYGVDQMGVGYKTVGGKITDKIALVFYVKRKKQKPELSSDQIPERIDGIATDVVVVPKGFVPR
jgi:hypothetical protein